MDTVLHWHRVASDANRAAHGLGAATADATGLARSGRALALVQLSVADAVAHSDGRDGYLPRAALPPAQVAQREVVSGAAHHALCALYPAQQARFAASMRSLGIDQRGAATRFGAELAARLLALRAGDQLADAPLTTAQRYGYAADPRRTEPRSEAPRFGANRCFLARTRPAVAAPPEHGSREHLEAVREVQALGICNALASRVPPARRRTPAQCLVGTFWGYYGSASTGTLHRLVDDVVRMLCVRHYAGRSDAAWATAKLLAQVACAMADATIVAYDYKYRFGYPRPVTAIREYDGALGAAPLPTDAIAEPCDPEWLPAGRVVDGDDAAFTSPESPGYPSARAAIAAAGLHVARLQFGVRPGDRHEDRLFDELALASDTHDGSAVDALGARRPRHLRAFTGGLWQMIDEVAVAGVVRGVNWPFERFQLRRETRGALGGVALGLAIAEDIHRQPFSPPDSARALSNNN